MNVMFSKTKVKSVRIEITTVNYKDYYQIDAIGICDCEYDYSPKINQPENVSYEEKINLGENVNSKYAELGPVITPDGTTLYFTRDQHPDNTGENKDQDIGIHRQIVWAIFHQPKI
jgi:hypothetical protein